LCYKINAGKYRTALFYYILTGGVFYIIHHFYPKYFIDMVCDPCDIMEAVYCVVREYDGNMTVSKLIRKNFFDTHSTISSINFKGSKEHLLSSNYIGKEFFNQNEYNIVYILKPSY